MKKMIELSISTRFFGRVCCHTKQFSFKRSFCGLTITAMSAKNGCSSDAELGIGRFNNCLNGREQCRVSTRLLSSESGEHGLSQTSISCSHKASLLKGLDIITVPAEDDGHPLAVYTIPTDGANDRQQRTPVLLLHGRTWSSVPVYHLVGGRKDNGTDVYGESRSLIEALFNTNRIQPYAMDFRGFGGTPKDASGFVEPLRCVKDVVSVLNWIQSCVAGGETGKEASRPALLGWSHGALIAQIVAQRHPDVMSKLIL